MVTEDQRPTALLLLGPTGVGKTPLGLELEDRGLWGRRCVHFDFGANLRKGAEGDLPEELLGNDERTFLERVIKSGALLEDDQFPIARKILNHFLLERRVDDAALIVLNGLPRHAGQAAAVESIVAVRAVITLTCEAATVLERIRTNAGGDRGERSDDDPASIRRRLATYAERTQPLVDYYRLRSVCIIQLPVGLTTSAGQLCDTLQGMRPTRI